MVVDYNTTALIWRGLYQFSQSAAKEIVEQYRKEPKIDDSVKVQFDPSSSTFILTGPMETADAGYQVFVALMKNYIEKHFSNTDQRKDPFVCPGKASRSFPTRLNAGNPVWTDSLEELEHSEEEEFDQLRREIDEKVTENEFTEYRKWTPRWRDGLRECFFPDGEDLISDIGRLSGCIVHMDWVAGDIKIGGHDLASINMFMEKLSLAEEYFNTPLKKQTAHLIYSEEKEQVEIHLVALTRQANTTARTTLFPPNHKYSSNAGRLELYSARISEYNSSSENFENVTWSCTQPYNSGRHVPEPWEGYIYTAKESTVPPPPVLEVPPPGALPPENENGLVMPPRPGGGEGPNVPLLERPLTLEHQKDASGNLQFGSRPKDDTGEVEKEEELPSMAPKRKVRAPRGGVKSPPAPAPAPSPAPRNFAASTSSSFTYSQSSNASETEGSTTPTGPRPRTAALPVGQTNSSRFPGPANASILPSRPVPQNEPGMPPAAGRRPRNKGRKTSVSGSDKDAEADTESIASSFTYGTSSTVSNSRTPKGQPEYKTRTFRETQRQRAPRRKQAFDNLADMTKYQNQTFHEVFDVAFEEARRFRGEIKFEVRIGRIVFPNVPKKYSKSTYAFQWNNWDSELKRIGIESVFSNMLTITPCDVDFAAGLKVTGGDSLFENPPGVMKVVYEIECQTMQGISFLVHINASTFEFTIRGKEERLGTVLWNCPTRNWDAEFALNGYHIVRSVQSQAKALVEAMKVEEGLQYPLIWVNKTNLNLKIIRATCLRETRHMVLPSEIHHGHEFTLGITEHIELRIQENPRFPGITRLAAVEGLESNRLNMTWWSMSLTADVLDLAFHDNRNLGIAQLASNEWKRDFMEPQKDGDGMSTLQAMVGVVGGIISRIDNVGSSNAQYSLYHEPAE